MMRLLRSLALLLVALAGAATAQTPKNKVAKAVGKLADSLASGAAAGAIDSILGKKMLGMLGTGSTPCVTRHPNTGAILAVVGSAPVGPGAAIVSAAKEAAGAKKGSTAAAAPGGCPAGSSAVSATELQALAMVGGAGAMPGSGMPGMPAGMGGAMAVGMPGAGAAGVPPGLGAIAAATPVGMAAAAAPTAIKGAKKLFGGGPMSSEDMAKGLARGRLELKGVKFLPGSDDLVEGADVVFQQLAEVLGGFKATFELSIAPEAEKGVEPDVELAQRRVEKAMALLMTSGIPEGAIVAGGAIPKEKLKDGKYPKLGDAKLELIKVVKAAP